MIIIYIYIKTELGEINYLSKKKISNALNIPAPTISKIIRSLIDGGILKSKEGKKGGFSLSMKLAELTFYDIFTAIERKKPLFKSNFDINLSGDKVEKVIKEINDCLYAAELAMKKELKDKKIKDLVSLYLE